MQVTVLTCRHITEYKTSESTCSLPSPFLRALKTQKFKDSACCPLLEQPNIVHDLPAAGGLNTQPLLFVTGCAGDLSEVVVVMWKVLACGILSLTLGFPALRLGQQLRILALCFHSSFLFWFCNFKVEPNVKYRFLICENWEF